MNYGWTCKKCGETVLGNNKEEVKQFKDSHSCNFVVTSYGTICRKSLLAACEINHLRKLKGKK